jgi:integrase
VPNHDGFVRGKPHRHDRARELIAVLWEVGPRIREALDLGELDLDPKRGSVLVRSGKGGRRREGGTENRGFEHSSPGCGRRSGDAG